jgi:H+-transporting ATPase
MDARASQMTRHSIPLGGTAVDVSRQEHGYNEVAREKQYPVLDFLKKFWGISAWMLELIMMLSAVLGKITDLAVVGTLLVANAVVSFRQEQRAAGVVETLRKRLQVSARVRRDGKWLIIPARDLVPGRHRSRATGGHHPGGRATPHGGLERRPIGTHG